MQGSFATLTKNLRTVGPGLVSFVAGGSSAFSTWKKIQDRTWKFAPESVRDNAEAYEPTYIKKHHSQELNMWVDKELATEVSQKDVANLMTFKQDAWKLMHGGLSALLFGGYSLPLYAIWLGNDTWVPSTFNTNEAELKEWRKAQDLYRYKFASAYLGETRWYYDHHAAPRTPKFERAWEEMWEKNDVRRDPKIARDAAEMYDSFIQLHEMRRVTGRLLGRAMGIPTFPLWSKICIGTRIRDYWQLAWNEDYIVISQKLHETMSDEELYDYAWRRYLAPYDKELTREQLLERVADYHTFLGDEFVQTGKAPNIFMTTSYCLGYYNEPAYLVEDIAELDANDFEHLASWPKDAFLRRLEFENGPLRDQVEAHSVKILEERKKAAAAKQVEA